MLSDWDRYLLENRDDPELADEPLDFEQDLLRVQFDDIHEHRAELEEVVRFVNLAGIEHAIEVYVAEGDLRRLKIALSTYAGIHKLRPLTAIEHAKAVVGEDELASLPWQEAQAAS